MKGFMTEEFGLEDFENPNPKTEDSGARKKKFKIIFVREIGTGKTYLICQYVYGFFSEYYIIHIGVYFFNKDLKWNGDLTIFGY
jgi:GTPase SAR1 family protein